MTELHPALSSHLYTWVERGTVRVKCLTQEHNEMSQARVWTRTAQSGDKLTNYEVLAHKDQNHNKKTPLQQSK